MIKTPAPLSDSGGQRGKSSVRRFMACNETLLHQSFRDVYADIHGHDGKRPDPESGFLGLILKQLNVLSEREGSGDRYFFFSS